MVEKFEKYVNNYDLTKEKIILKKNHSIRVMNLCIKYAKKLGFNDDIRCCFGKSNWFTP